MLSFWTQPSGCLLVGLTQHLQRVWMLPSLRSEHSVKACCPTTTEKTEAQFKYGVNYFRSKTQVHTHIDSLLYFSLLLFPFFSNRWMLNWKLFFFHFIYMMFIMLPVLYYTSLLTAHHSILVQYWMYIAWVTLPPSLHTVALSHSK